MELPRLASAYEALKNPKDQNFETFLKRGVAKPPFFCYNMLSFALILARSFT